MKTEENSSFVLCPSSFDAGKRLDAFLAEQIENLSRSRLQKMITDGDVLVNGTQAKNSYKISETDKIEVELTEIAAESFEPEDIPLEIIYEDEFLAVINKKAGMVVHPGAGVSSGTMANALAFKFKIKNENLKIDTDLDKQSKI